ncbi:hypothetical protein HDU96_003683 [Phlyctochytrium bullatum]|nr:hypothetical protein HDU96_003683 [Phlyctochytrium bullatum]
MTLENQEHQQQQPASAASASLEHVHDTVSSPLEVLENLIGMPSSNSDMITRVIVVAVDQSPHSEYALDWAVKNYIRPSTDLVVLMNVRPHVATPGPYGSMFDFSEFVMTAEQQQKEDSHRLLQDSARILRRHKICCKAIALRGDAREELVTKVEEINPDAFIIGSRGFGTLKRTLLGSVSDYCVHHIRSCPVVVVKHQPVDAAQQQQIHGESAITGSVMAPPNMPVVPATLH